MARYFPVDKLFDDVRNTKAELDDLGKRLKSLKDAVFVHLVDDTEDESLPYRFRTNQYQDLPEYLRRFFYDKDKRMRESAAKRSPADKVTPAVVLHPDSEVLPVGDSRSDNRSLRLDIATLKARLSNLRSSLAVKNADGSKSEVSSTNEQNRSPKPSKKPVAKRVNFSDRLRKGSQTRSAVARSTAGRGDRARVERIRRNYIPTDETSEDRLKTYTICSVKKHSAESQFLSGSKRRQDAQVATVRRHSVRPKIQNATTVLPRAKVDDRVQTVSSIRRDLFGRQNRCPEWATALPNDIAIQRQVVEKMRDKYFGSLGKNCVYRIINLGDVASPQQPGHSGKVVAKKVASVQTTCPRHANSGSPAHDVPVKAASTVSHATTVSNGSFHLNSPPSSINGSAGTGSTVPAMLPSADGQTPSGEEEEAVSSSTSAKVDLHSSGEETVRSASSAVQSQEDVKTLEDKRLSLVKTESEVSDIPAESNGDVSFSIERGELTTSAQLQTSSINGPSLDMESHEAVDGKSALNTNENLLQWSHIHIKALQAYFEVQIALLRVEKSSLCKSCKESADYIDKRVEELKAKLEEEIRSYKASTLSIVDEIRAVGHLQQETAVLQKKLTELCKMGLSYTRFEASIQECAKVLKERQSRAKHLMRERRALERSAESIARLEQEAYKAWSLPAGSLKQSSPSSSSERAAVALNGVTENLDQENQLTPPSGRAEYEARIRSLKKELQVKKDVARRLTFEYQQRSKQQFKAHEQSLAKQIEIYDKNISETEKLISGLVGSSTQSVGEVESELPRDVQPPETIKPQLDELLKDTESDESSLSNALRTGEDNKEVFEIESSRESSKSLSSIRSPSGGMGSGDAEELVDQLAERMLSEVASEVFSVFLTVDDATGDAHSEAVSNADKRPVLVTFDSFKPSTSSVQLSQPPLSEPLLPKRFVPQLNLSDVVPEVDTMDTPLPVEQREACPAMFFDDVMMSARNCPESIEVVKALLDVSVERLHQYATSNANLWQVPKPAELYFVGCEMAASRPDQDRHFRDFIFDFCRDIVAQLYGVGQEHRLGPGGPATQYVCSAPLVRHDLRYLKDIVHRVVLQQLFPAEKNAKNSRLAAVSRRQLTDVESNLLNEMLDEEPAWNAFGAEEEQLRTEVADGLLQNELDLAVDESIDVLKKE